MTTTAYDTHFIASDIAFTTEDGIVHLDIPFRKVKRIGDVVVGMAGCLNCMAEFCQAALDFVLQKTPKIVLPDTIISRLDRDMIALVYAGGMCLKISKLVGGSNYEFENVTQIPTVIGSGSQYTQDIIRECPNALVAVLEAIKKDKYTEGEVKYCSIRRGDVHNLELIQMSTNLQVQVTGLQAEIAAANEVLATTGKSYKASTETYHVGEPTKIPTDLGLQMLEQVFMSARQGMTE